MTDEDLVKNLAWFREEAGLESAYPVTHPMSMFIRAIAARERLKKREWVGLTDEEIEPIAETVAQPKQEQGEPVGWMSNKDFEPIRIRIMQEAYELADSNNPEGYNAIKVMCGDVQKMLSPQRTWAGLTDEEIEKVWRGVRANEYHSCVEPFAKDIEAKLKEKNT